MDSSSYYGINKRLDVLNLIKQNIIDSSSPSLTNEVKFSTEIIIKGIHSSIIQIATKIISFEFIDEIFQKGTDGYQAFLAIYKFDKILFDKVIHKVFDNIVEDDNFKKIVKSLTQLEDNGAKIDAYCKLYAFISRIYENLYGFECAVKKLLKDESLQPIEIEKLKELVKKIEECSHRYLIASSIASSIEYDY